MKTLRASYGDMVSLWIVVSGMENNICERNMNPDDMYSKVLFFKLRAWRPPQERKT